MDILNTLVEKRNAAFAAVQAQLETVDSDNWTAEDRSAFDAANTHIDSLDARIEELRSIAAREERYSALTDGIENVTLAHRAEAGAPETREAWQLFLDGELRDLTVGTASAGGNLVPTNVSSDVINTLETLSAIRKLARVITTPDAAPVALPKVSTNGLAALQAENVAITEAGDPAFSQVILNAYKFGSIVEVSRELQISSVADLQSLVISELARAVGRAQMAAFATGGNGTTANGLFAQTQDFTSTNTGKGGAPSFNDLVDLQFTIDAEYQTNASWVMSKSAVAAVRKLADSTGQPIWTPAAVAGTPATLLGSPVYIDGGAPACAVGAKSIAYGDISRAYVIRQVGGEMVIDSDDSVGFARDVRTFRARSWADGEIADRTAFALFKGAAT